MEDNLNKVKLNIEDKNILNRLQTIICVVN